MREYRADLHIHTVLSPCGDLTMSPVNIISEALRKKIDIIGITDHNSVRQSLLIKKMASLKGIYTLTGAEVTTREEVHCLAFFENTDTLESFQEYLSNHLPDIKNVPEIFGDQVVVDENENITWTEEKLLTNALDISLEELERYVHSIGGLFIPAHIDRVRNGIYGQLGFFPAGLKADALEVSWRNEIKTFSESRPELAPYALIRNSDAHFPEHIGRASTVLQLEAPTFKEISMAFRSEAGRRISGW